MGVNVGILCVSVVLFMAIQAIEVVAKAAPMDSILGTFLLCNSYFIFIYLFGFLFAEFLVGNCHVCFVLFTFRYKYKNGNGKSYSTWVLGEKTIRIRQ